MRFDALTLFFSPLFLIMVGMFSARFLILFFVFFWGGGLTVEQDVQQ